MVITRAVLLPLLYTSSELPEGIDIKKQKKLVDNAFSTGWRVRFHKIFSFEDVVYERYIFEKEVEDGTLNDSNIAG